MKYLITFSLILLSSCSSVKKIGADNKEEAPVIREVANQRTDEFKKIAGLLFDGNTKEALAVLKKTRRVNEITNGLQYNLLHESIIHKNSEVFHYLMSLKIFDLNNKNAFEQAPIHLAVDLNEYDMVFVLLANKANVNDVNGFDYTPLHIAAKNESIDIIRLLMEYKANPNLLDFMGHKAEEISNDGIKKMLIQYREKTNSLNNVLKGKQG